MNNSAKSTNRSKAQAKITSMVLLALLVIVGSALASLTWVGTSDNPNYTLDADDIGSLQTVVCLMYSSLNPPDNVGVFDINNTFLFNSSLSIRNESYSYCYSNIIYDYLAFEDYLLAEFKEVITSPSPTSSEATTFPKIDVTSSPPPGLNISLTGAYGEHATCQATSCYFDINVTNNRKKTISVFPANVRASDYEHKSLIKSSDAFVPKVVERLVNVTQVEEREYRCEGLVKTHIEQGKGANETARFICEDTSKEQVLFDREYKAYDPDTNTFTYDEVKEVEEVRLVKENSKAGIPLKQGETATVRVQFAVPINSQGKFDVELDVEVDGEMLTLIYDPWWNSTFPYKQEIKVQDNTNHAKTDYQIKLELDDTSVGANFNWTNNGTDIRFMNASETLELPYFIKSWDSVAEEAEVWVKVDVIPKSDNGTIYMYYGNMEASAASNGTATFILYEDCEDISDWTATNRAWGTSGSAGSKVCTSPSVADSYEYLWKAIDTDSKINYTLEVDYSSTGEYGTHNIIIQLEMGDNPPSGSTLQTDRYVILWNRAATPKYYQARFVNDTGTYTNAESAPFRTSTWNNYGLIAQPQNITFVREGSGVSSLIGSGDDYLISGSNITYALFGLRRMAGSFDNITVRKYEYPEPTYYIGAEEEPSSGITTITWNSPYNTTINTDSVTLNWTTDQDATSCNLSFNGTWYNQTTGYCYQETANDSHASDGDCGLSYNGNYSGDAEIGAFIDGDWDTSTQVFNLYINYSKPNGASSALWRTKDHVGETNLSIPESCFKESYLKLYVKTIIGAGLDHDTGLWMCYNGTDYEILREFSEGWSAFFYEEGIYWSFGDSKTNWTQEVTGLSDGNYSTINVTCSDDTTAVTSANMWLDVEFLLTDITWNSPYNTTITTPSVTLNWTTNENATSCNLSFGGLWYNQTDNKTSWTQGITNLTHGNYTNIQVTCSDALTSVTSSSIWLFADLMTASWVPFTGANTTLAGVSITPTWTTSFVDYCTLNSSHGNYTLEGLTEITAYNSSGYSGPWTTPANIVDNNYNTYSAIGGVNAVYNFQYNRPAGIWSDIRWRVKDGYGTTDLIVPELCWANDPLIFRVLTSAAEDEDEPSGGGGGGFGVSSDPGHSGIYSVSWQCYGSSWITIRKGDTNRVYEESLIHYSGDEMSLPLSYTTPVNETFNVTCYNGPTTISLPLTWSNILPIEFSPPTPASGTTQDVSTPLGNLFVINVTTYFPTHHCLFEWNESINYTMGKESNTNYWNRIAVLGTGYRSYTVYCKDRATGDYYQGETRNITFTGVHPPDLHPPEVVLTIPENDTIYYYDYPSHPITFRVYTNEPVLTCRYSTGAWRDWEHQTLFDTYNDLSLAYGHTFATTTPVSSGSTTYYIICEDVYLNRMTSPYIITISTLGRSGGGGDGGGGGSDPIVIEIPGTNETRTVYGGDFILTPPVAFKWDWMFYDRVFNHTVRSTIPIASCSFEKFSCSIADDPTKPYPATIVYLTYQGSDLPNEPGVFVEEIGQICGMDLDNTCKPYHITLQGVNLNWHVPLDPPFTIQWLISPNGINIIPMTSIGLAAFALYSYNKPRRKKKSSQKPPK
jgi:hypothetical protein